MTTQQQPADYHQPAIEADAPAEEFSDYGSGVESETFSVASSLNNYFEQNGRRYHVYFGPDKNPMPNDDKEQKRLDIAHEAIYNITNGKIYHSPIENAHRVLDLGTGTGTWAIEYAQQHPHSEVVGIDLSPIQPGWVPPNCRFEIDDFELEWNYHRPFDFILARTLAQSVRDWPKLLSEAKRNLTPGGWFEMGEWGFEHRSDDNTIPEDWPPLRVFALLREGLVKSGCISPTGDNMKQLLIDNGFEDVRLETYKLPIGPWAKNPRLKDAGLLSTASIEMGGYEAYTLRLGTKVLGVPADELLKLCKDSLEAHLDRKSGVHAYIHYYVAYGRKPKD